MFGIHDYKKLSISLVFNYLWNHFTLQSWSWQNKYPVALIEVCMAVTIILSCSKTNFMFSFHNYHPAQWTELVQQTSRVYLYDWNKFFNRRSWVGSSLALTKVVVWLFVEGEEGGCRITSSGWHEWWKNQYIPNYRQCKFSTKSLKYIKLNYISFVLLFQWTTRKIHLQYMVDAFWINLVHLFWFPHNWLLQQCSFCLRS